MTTRLVIADDERLIRAGYRMILDSEPDLEVVGEAGDGVEAVELARRLAPDVVLMDVRMPRLDGMIALGLSNSDIASALSISDTTVKTHVSRMLAKLGLASRSQAVVLAYETGLVRPGQTQH